MYIQTVNCQLSGGWLAQQHLQRSDERKHQSSFAVEHSYRIRNNELALFCCKNCSFGEHPSIRGMTLMHIFVLYYGIVVDISC